MYKITLFFLIFCTPFFSQNKKIASTIALDTNFKIKEIAPYFEYNIANSMQLKTNYLKENLLWKLYEKESFVKLSKSINSNFYLWLRTNIQNNTKDTLNLVMSLNNYRKSKIVLKSNTKTEFKSIGYQVDAPDLDFKRDSDSFKIKLLPFQKRQITIQTYVDFYSQSGIDISLQTQEFYDSAALKRIDKYNYLYALFTLLSGGILIMLLYNLVLFFQYQERNYLYYSLHLFFTLFNYCLISDGLHHDFFGNLNHFADLMLESSYTLSFVFYSVFVFSVLSDATQRQIRKLFVFYVGFMLVYFLSVQSVFFIDNPDVISSFVYPALIFRLVSCFYGFYIIYQLLKIHQNSYLKYIMYGTLVLIISYFIHVVCNLFFGNSIINHFFNLIGTLIEILFFTYALNLRKKLAEQERDVLIQMNVLKSKFFANISHEFRTPLTLIKSPVQSLLSKTVDKNKEVELKLIDSNANRMLELVDQLLELSKIDSGNLKLILKEGNVGSFLHSVVESFVFYAKEHQREFVLSIQKWTQNYAFDKDVIQKITTNLLSNAFKYSKENQTITFNSFIENQILQLKVSNSGSEIKKQDLPKLFERFYQKKETSQGVGIGLSLVKELVELYKGTITSDINNGVLSFIVSIPLENVANSVVLPVVQNQNHVNNTGAIDTNLPILLIVDDNEDIRGVIATIFKDSYQLFEAHDGAHAFKLAQKVIPDCIISDVVMPIMDGFQLTKSLKNNELTSFIPIVLLTAKSSDAYKLEGLESTADAFLTKPFNNEILKATVNQLIEERKKLQKRYSQEVVLRPVDIVINSVDERFLEKVQEVLNKEMSNSDFSSDNFASAVGMSRMQLHRKLKSLLGVTTTEFLRNERLKTAVVLLENGNGNISEIAYSVGFNDVSYFSKCFKTLYDTTPTEYLNKKLVV